MIGIAALAVIACVNRCTSAVRTPPLCPRTSTAARDHAAGT